MTDGPMASLHQDDCLRLLAEGNLGPVAAMVTDPPYGMDYRSGTGGRFGDAAVPGDTSTALRDAALQWAAANGIPVLCFGTWKVPRPAGTRMVLTWDKGDGVGMGDLGLPWKGNTEEVYVIGRGFAGHRGSSVLRINALSPNFVDVREPREHPTQKPVALIARLVEKCPPGAILDPFMGSGTTGVACMRADRDFVGIEIDPGWYQVACRRITEARQQLRMAL